MAEKKVTRKELLNEPDEFLTTTARLILYVREHPRQVFVAALLVFVFLAAGGGIYSYQRYQEQQSHRLFQKALWEYERATQANQVLTPEQINQLLAEFESITKTYPSLQAGEQALLYTGHVLFEKKDYREALDRYNRMQATSIVKKGLAPMVLYHVGRTRLALDEYEQAALIFDQLSKDTNSPYRREAYASIARIYELMDKKKEAVQAYRQYLKIFPEAPDAAFVKSRIVRLSAQG